MTGAIELSLRELARDLASFRSQWVAIARGSEPLSLGEARLADQLVGLELSVERLIDIVQRGGQ